MQRRNLAVCLAASLGIATAAGVVTALPASAAAGCTVTYQVSSSWPGGFGANVTINNLGDAIGSWTLVWSFGAGQTVTQAWNTTLTQSGSTVTAKNVSYNGSIATNGTASFGFNGSWTGTNPAPTGFSLNGTACTGTVTNPIRPHTARLRLPDVSKWTYNLVGMYEGHGLTLRLAYNLRTGYPEGGLSNRGDFTLQGRAHSVSRLDWSSSYAVTPNVTLFFDWTNILGKPYKSDIVRVNYNTGTGAVTGNEAFPMIVRFEESVLTGGVRFRF